MRKQNKKHRPFGEDSGRAVFYEFFRNEKILAESFDDRGPETAIKWASMGESEVGLTEKVQKCYQIRTKSKEFLLRFSNANEKTRSFV